MPPKTALKWLKVLRVIGWLFVFGLPAYWAFSYTGLYALLSDLQTKVFGDYMGLISWAISFVIVSIPSIYLSGRIDSIATRGMSPAETSAYYKRAYIGDIEKSERYERRLLRNTPLILSCVALIGGVGGGGYFLLQSRLVGPLTTIDIGSVNPAQKPPSRY